MPVSRKVLPVIAVGTGLLVGLALGEVGLRALVGLGVLPDDNPFVAFIGQVDAMPISSSIYRYSEDDVLKVEFIPDSRRDHIRINSQGFRGREYSRRVPEGTNRIAFVGDSETFGAALKEENTITGRLEAILNEESAGERFEVLNFGFPGYNAIQKLRVVTHRAVQFNPRLVVLYYVLNDPITPGISRILERKFYYHSYVVLLFRWFEHAFIPATDIYREAHRARTIVDVYTNLHFSKAFDRIASGMKEIGRFLLRRNIRFMVVIAPEIVAFDDFADYPYRPVHERLLALASDDVEIVDPLEALAKSGYGPLEFWMTRTDVHKNEKANTLIAKRIARAVLDNGAFGRD